MQIKVLEADVEINQYGRGKVFVVGVYDNENSLAVAMENINKEYSKYRVNFKVYNVSLNRYYFDSPNYTTY